MGHVHSAKALDLLIELWHSHDRGHPAGCPTGPRCPVCKPLHFLLGWSWEEYKTWVETSIQPIRKEPHLGTRGIVGVIVGGTAKTAYNHYDSYPDGLGLSVLRELRSLALNASGKHEPAAYWEPIARRAAELRMVSHTGPKPTPEDIAALAPYTDLSVSEGTTDDWYCLTRKAQGSLATMLDSGYMLDAEDFPHDSLFCEWGWVLNLDEGTFEAYRGFQKAPHDDGFWGGLEPLEKSRYGDYGYHAIRRVASWPLLDLPTDAAFLKAFAREDED